MKTIINLYCDESCHLENDRQPVMGFGVVRCAFDDLKEVAAAIAALKQKHNARGELKWEKVSPSRMAFYEELVDWFFKTREVRFRGWLVKSKSKLTHAIFNDGGHDEFYYKMYYYLLEPLIKWPLPGEVERCYRIFMDVKDTRSRLKVAKLGDVLRSKKHDWNRSLISHIQSVPADEVQAMQLADFLLGALTYRNRPEQQQSEAKKACVRRIEARAGFALVGNTPPWEERHLTTREDKSLNPSVRLPDLRRCERLSWIKPMILRCPCATGDVKHWDHQEGDGAIKTYVWLHLHDFLIILKKLPDGRRRLITSFHLDNEHVRRKTRRKWERRIT